jgi:hypothetical protein
MLKQILPFSLIFLVLGILLLVSLNIPQTSVGPHGGIVKVAGNYNIEMKSPYGNLYTWILDYKLSPLNNKGVTCEARFYFSDNTIVDTRLKPFGEDGFTTTTANDFLSCRITYKVAGKSVSAKFENENVIVQKKLD